MLRTKQFSTRPAVAEGTQGLYSCTKSMFTFERKKLKSRKKQEKTGGRTWKFHDFFEIIIFYIYKHYRKNENIKQRTVQVFAILCRI